jgi:FkbM family methyltransferase
MEFAHQAEKSLFQRLHHIGAAPAVVYDIGASNGGWSAIVSEGLPAAEYHLFEPLWDHPEYRKLLQKRLSDHPNWRLHRVALADRNGTATMCIPLDAVGSTILDMYGWDRRTVDQYRLDDYVAKSRLPLPKAVKMDTQAGEHLILAGGKETISAADILIVETWFYRCYAPSAPLLGEIISVAESMGFFALELGECYQDEQGKMLTVDVFFAKPAIAKELAKIKRPTAFSIFFNGAHRHPGSKAFIQKAIGIRFLRRSLRAAKRRFRRLIS